MGLAWATIGLVLFLLPGFLFHIGVTFPEDFTRENVKREQLGQLTGAVLVAFIVHAGLLVFLDGLVLHTGWAWPVVDLDAFIPRSGPDGTASLTFAQMVGGLREAKWQLLTYFATACLIGWLIGAEVGLAIVGGRLGSLVRHPWVYRLKVGLVYAHVLTHKREGERVLLYSGLLTDFSITDEGNFSYLVLRRVYRNYLYLDEEGPRSPVDRATRLGAADDSTLVIEGEDIANVVMEELPADPGTRPSGAGWSSYRGMRRIFPWVGVALLLWFAAIHWMPAWGGALLAGGGTVLLRHAWVRRTDVAGVGQVDDGGATPEA